jgi:putative membrane protein
VLSKLQSDAKMIKDPDVKALADAHTPVVEQHLKSAQQMSEDK